MAFLAKSWRRAALAVLLGAAVPDCPGGLGVPVPIPAEQQLEAVFLFNFAQFVDWPAPANLPRGAPFVIGILGPDPFGPYLDALVAGERVDGHPLAIRRLAPGDDPAGCRILFCAGNDLGRFAPVLARLGGAPVLTVGDAPGFARAGGVIAFRLEGGKLRLNINVKAAAGAGLVISSKLLRLSTVVRSNGE